MDPSLKEYHRSIQSWRELPRKLIPWPFHGEQSIYCSYKADISKVYFEDSNEEGIHLVYTTIEENNNAIMNISAKNGTSIIEEGEFNMDHESPTRVFHIINTLLRERTKKEELDDLFKN